MVVIGSGECIFLLFKVNYYLSKFGRVLRGLRGTERDIWDIDPRVKYCFRPRNVPLSLQYGVLGLKRPDCQRQRDQVSHLHNKNSDSASIPFVGVLKTYP